jgi:hypothetical protein
MIDFVLSSTPADLSAVVVGVLESIVEATLRVGHTISGDLYTVLHPVDWDGFTPYSLSLR